MSFHTQVKFPSARSARAWMSLLALSLTVTGMARAAHGSEPLPEGFGLLIALPGATTELAEVALQRAPEALEGAERAPVSWVATDDPRFVTSVRLELHKNETLVRATPPCELETPQFSVLVHEIEDALKFLDFEAALQWAGRTDAAFACDQDIISPQMLSRYALLQGILERKLSRSDRGWFLTSAALHVDSMRLELESEAVQGLYERARASLAHATRVPATVQLEQAGLEVWVDGVRVSTPDIGLLPGAHFVQLVSPDGRALRGSIEQVSMPEAGAPREPLVLPPRTMAVQGADTVSLRLREAVRAGRLDAVLSSTLIATLARGRHPWMLLLTPEEGTTPARGLWLLPTGSTIPVKLSTGISPLGMAGTGTLALATIGSGVGLAVFLAPMITGTLVRDADPYVAGALSTGALAVAGLGATAVVASRTWRIPRALYRRTQLPPPPAKQSKLELRGGVGWVALEVSLP